MTAWADILTRAMVIIDDDRWREQLDLSPAEFYRAKSDYVRSALSLLCRPPELLTKLKNGMVLPSYTDAEWVSTQESTEGESVVETGAAGYDLCSVIQANTDAAGNVYYTAASGIAYDPETGNVTFPVQAQAGTRYLLDFYTDGAFEDLTETQMRLYSLAVAVIWDENFSRVWLDMTPKIHDASFTTVNEGNYLNTVTRRLVANRQSFNDELRKYEQDVAYYNVVTSRGGGAVTLI